MNKKDVVLNIRKAVDGDLESTFNLILKYEKLIDEECQFAGKYKEECKDYVLDGLLRKIKITPRSA